MAVIDQSVTTITTTPPGCPACSSKLDVIAAIAYVLRILNNSGTFSLTGALEDSACFKCDSDKQLLDIILRILVDYTASRDIDIDIASALLDSHCLRCADPKAVRAIITYELGVLANTVSL